MLKLFPNSKVPAVAKGESIDSATSDDPAEVMRWVKEGYNVGLRLENRTVVDFDDGKEAARQFVRANQELCSIIVETRRGIHLHFFGSTRPRKFPHGDLKSGKNAYVVCPPSVVAGFQYAFKRNGDLQPFPEDLFPDVRKMSESVIDPSVDRLRLITRAMAYGETMEPSVSGQHGHTAAFRFACKMVRQPPNGFGLTIEEAWSIALMFNQRCLPPWDEASLQRKLVEAARKDGV
jgi:bifunctional DNA primase/polymerase-like protein